MKTVKIAIVGNSVGLRIRPPARYPFNKNYGVILEELLQNEYPNKVFLVRNLSVGRSTLWEVLRRREYLLNVFPHYYVINLGVTDASTREIPFWFSNIIFSHNEAFLRKILHAFYIYAIVPFRPWLVRIRGKRPWTSKKKFKDLFEKLISYLAEGSNAQIIVMSIHMPSERIEIALPGSTANYLEYNRIMKEIASGHNAYYLDTTKLIEPAHSPDGIHLSREGHFLIARKLFAIIKELEKERP